jgi:hypothetical protein
MLNKAVVFQFGLTVALVLSELCGEYDYWEAQGKVDAQGYFFSTMRNLIENTTLNEHKIREACKTLQALGLISTELKGCPQRKFFKINEQQVFDATILSREEIRKKREKATESVPEVNNDCNSLKFEAYSLQDVVNSHYKSEGLSTTGRSDYIRILKKDTKRRILKEKSRNLPLDETNPYSYDENEIFNSNHLENSTKSKATPLEETQGIEPDNRNMYSVAPAPPSLLEQLKQASKGLQAPEPVELDVTAKPKKTQEDKLKEKFKDELNLVKSVIIQEKLIEFIKYHDKNCSRNGIPRLKPNILKTKIKDLEKLREDNDFNEGDVINVIQQVMERGWFSFKINPAEAVNNSPQTKYNRLGSTFVDPTAENKSEGPDFKKLNEEETVFYFASMKGLGLTEEELYELDEDAYAEKINTQKRAIEAIQALRSQGKDHEAQEIYETLRDLVIELFPEKFVKFGFGDGIIHRRQR